MTGPELNLTDRRQHYRESSLKTIVAAMNRWQNAKYFFGRGTFVTKLGWLLAQPGFLLPSRTFVFITRTNYLHFLMFSSLLVLHSIDSYLVLPVSTPFEPTAIRCRVHSLFVYFGYKRQVCTATARISKRRRQKFAFYPDDKRRSARSSGRRPGVPDVITRAHAKKRASTQKTH